MATELDAVQSPDGETLYVDRSDAEVGAQAPFFVVYATPDRLDRWGFFCGNCESTDTAMDTMGRIECNVCGNVRKPDEWDAAHE
ncbi:DUF5816 domain-containing protein [Halobellus marinus]|jgi:hypothetical protein|uniref:DUF5816 domain-containing protein n=1 Tax=Halobellus TaxID=1073986 RepID=UPI0028B18E6A|nr:DUF5816 domain-containing protein [Halobellus sp. DFY28]